MLQMVIRPHLNHALFIAFIHHLIVSVYSLSDWPVLYNTVLLETESQKGPSRN